jgi:hypothetical protein
LAIGPNAIKQMAEKNYSEKCEFLHRRVNFQNSIAIKNYSENERKIYIMHELPYFIEYNKHTSIVRT